MSEKPEVEFDEVEVVTNVYRTPTHVFKINAETLEKMREGKEFLLKIGTKIQKNLRQLEEKSNGREWQLSYEAIFEEITNQRIIKGGLVPPQ